MVDETAAPRRSLAYAADCIASREYLKETRTLGAFKFFISQWEKCRSDIDKTEWRYHSKDLMLRCLEWICFYLGYALSFLLAARSLFPGEITVGLLRRRWPPSVTCNHRQAQSFRISERPRGDAHFEENCAIHLEGVSFKYPSAEGFCLTDINLTIRPGETLAIVGANGAGKTTLSKVIIGLLAPQTGRVLCGGVDALSDSSAD